MLLILCCFESTAPARKYFHDKLHPRHCQGMPHLSILIIEYLIWCQGIWIRSFANY
jgi:hypothetical protein